jgi:hypothetical protein
MFMASAIYLLHQQRQRRTEAALAHSALAFTISLDLVMAHSKTKIEVICDKMPFS